MKNFSLFLLSLGIVVISISCNRQQAEIEYNLDALDNMPADSVMLSMIETDIEFGNPETIDFINDTLMIVFDSNVNDNVAHIISTNGHHIRSFGRKGKGEGEIISPSDISLSENKDSIFIFDSMLKRMIGFDTRKLLEGDEQIPSQLNLNNEIPGIEYGFYHVETGKNGQMFAFGPSKIRIATLKNGNLENEYSDYPLTDPDEETNRSIWNYTGSLNFLSPDRTKLIVATHIGGLFEIFDISDGKLKSRSVKGFYKPQYSYAEGAIPKCVIPDPQKYVAGFRSLSTGNDDFIAIIDGPDGQRINELFYFDYDGNVKNRNIVKNYWINKVGRNDKNEIYCIAWDKDFKNMNLYRIDQ